MNNIEDIYPLSPMQQGMLFHTLYEPRSGAYVMQVTGTAPGGFNLAAFKSAWERLIAHHPVLRTSFVWERRDEPLQVVRRRAALPWEVLDWRGLSEQQAGLEALCEADRKRGFDLARAPLLRLTVVRLRDDLTRFVFSYHHIILDGWSLPQLFSGLFALYEAAERGVALELPQTRPYRDYIAWLGQQDKAEAERFWRAHLGDFSSATPLDDGRVAEGAPDARQEERQLSLSEELTAALQNFTRQNRLTLNTLVQGAWAFLLAHQAGVDDVVFGVTVAGRPAALVGVESMVGLFINALPMRVRLDAEAPLASWLAEIQRRQVEMRRYEHYSLNDIRRLTRAPRGQALFQSLLTFENYPVSDSLLNRTRSLEIGDVRDATMNNFPLTIIAAREAGLSLRFVYDAKLIGEATVRGLLGQMAALLEAFTETPGATLGAFRETLEGLRKEQLAIEQRKREQMNLNRFKKITPKAVSFSQESLVKLGSVAPGVKLPLVIEPAVEDLDVIDWVANNRAFVESELLRHGAVLFRGCRVETPAAFEQLAQAVCRELFGEYGDLPRESLGGKIYGSTPYPSDRPILFHNESSHTDRWPMKIFFHCVTAAESGGETPLVNCREVCRRLDPAVLRRFTEKKLMYVRNYTDELDVSWQEFFGSNDRATVEDRCRRAGMGFEWLAGGNLRTKKICQAVARHPRTGDQVFFNQIHLHHVSCLHPSLRESVLSLFGEDEFPRHVYYGDGTPIEEGVIEETLGVHRELARGFAWRPGDVLLLDNMLTAHGRSPFMGARRILVAMGEMVSGEEVTSSAARPEAEA
jgi:alpha-ketoglutarate-dependent taurine dioxygenase